MISKTGTTSSFEPSSGTTLAISKTETTSSFEPNSGTVQPEATKAEITTTVL